MRNNMGLNTLKKSMITIAGVGLAALVFVVSEFSDDTEGRDIFNSIQKSKPARYWADTVGNDNQELETNEAIRFAAFTRIHNGAYVYPRKNSGFFPNLQDAVEYARENPNSNSIDKVIYHIDKHGELIASYNLEGIRTYPRD